MTKGTFFATNVIRSAPLALLSRRPEHELLSVDKAVVRYFFLVSSLPQTGLTCYFRQPLWRMLY
jgi:hypothetical protein